MRGYVILFRIERTIDLEKSKKALLVVSFGTSHADTRERTIDRIESALASALPERELYRAWTSGMIIRKLRKEQGIIVPTVTEAMEKMHSDGVTDVLVQPTHILNGIENDIMTREIDCWQDKFEKITFSTPLLTDEEDCRLTVEAIARELRPSEGDTALVLMGHGTEHYTNPVYAALDYRFKEMGYDNVFMGTVEAYPSVENTLNTVRKNSRIKNIVLAPFMIVAGDHAKNDMAGDEDDSWKSIFENAGYNTQCVLKGLGEFQPFVDIFVKHAREAEKG